MKGYDILVNLIGKSLKQGKVQSFYLNGKLEDKVNLVYLEFDNWIKIVTGDESTRIDKKKPETIETFLDGSSKFEYPLVNIEQEFNEFKSMIGLSLVDFKELIWSKNNFISCGLRLYFENNKSITIYLDKNDRTQLYFDEVVFDEVEEK